RADGSDTHGGAVAHGALAAECGRRDPMPGFAVADGGKNLMGRRAVAAMGILAIATREDLGEVILMNSAVAFENLGDSQSHLGAVRVPPRSWRDDALPPHNALGEPRLKKAFAKCIANGKTVKSETNALQSGTVVRGSDLILFRH